MSFYPSFCSNTLHEANALKVYSSCNEKKRIEVVWKNGIVLYTALLLTDANAVKKEWSWEKKKYQRDWLI